MDQVGGNIYFLAYLGPFLIDYIYSDQTEDGRSFSLPKRFRFLNNEKICGKIYDKYNARKPIVIKN